MTVQDLADKANTSRIYIQEVKGGKKEPSQKWLKSIALALGCEVRDLYESTGMQEHHHAPTADAKLVCEAVRITEEHIAVRGYQENKEAKQCMTSLIFEILKEQSASGYRYHLGETILDMAAEKAGYKTNAKEKK